MTKATVVNAANIPTELKNRPQWVVWRYEARNGEQKPTKVPYAPRTGRRADSTDPRTWSTFDESLAVYERGDWAGIGYVLSPDDPYTGVDLDHALDGDGKVKPWAMYYVDGLNSYTEVSPSGKGLRIFTRAAWPYDRHKKGDIEIYADKRFLTLTGNHLPDTPQTINDRSEVMPIIYADVFDTPPLSEERPQLPTQPVDIDDTRLIEKAHAARYGSEFAALWRGDTSAYSGDDSRADYHLIKSLLFWTGGDDSRADRLFRQSGLMRPKWDERRGDSTYGDRTMAAALQNLRAVYNPQVSPNGHTQSQPFGAPGQREIQSFAESALSEPNETRPRFQILHADELDTMPPVEWLVDDELAAGQFNLVWGPSQGGKSFYMLDRALNIAQKQPVIYVAAEDAQGYAARKIAWCKHHGKGASQLYFVPQPVNLFDAKNVQDFIEQVARPLSPVLLVFDTLARCMVGADENSARDMGVVVENLEQIRRTTGSAVCPVHHAGKDGKSYRGSSALFAAAYASVEVSKDDDVITISCDKAKNTPEFKARKFRLVQVETGRTLPDGQLETSCVFLPSDQVDDSQDTTLNRNRRKILELLAWEVFVSSGAKSTAIGDTLNLKGGSLYTPLSWLLKHGYARQASKGDPYFITDAGVLALSGSVADRKQELLTTTTTFHYQK